MSDAVPHAVPHAAPDPLPDARRSAQPEVVGDAMWAQDHASQAAGLTLATVSDGRAVVTLTVDARHVNGLGVCHGGYIFLLADTAMAFASNSDNVVALAAAASIDFIEPARLGETLTASATYLQTGKRSGISDVEVRSFDGRLVALFRGRTSKTGAKIL